MVSFTRRLALIVKWILIVLVVSAAVLTASMRIVLPNLDTAKAPLQRWASDATGFNVDFSTVKGHWRYLAPSLSLHDLSLSAREGEQSVLTADSIEMQFDVVESIKRREPTFSHVSIDGLNLDVTQLPEDEGKETKPLTERLENLFLVGLGRFSIQNADITVLSPSEQRKTIDVRSLLWENKNGTHHVQGVVSVEGTSLNLIEVRGAFSEHNGLASLDGDFYLKADDLSLKDWIKRFINPNIAIASAKVGGEAWFTLKKGEPESVLLNLTESGLVWHANTPAILPSERAAAKSVPLQEQNQSLTIERGKVLLEKQGTSTWRVASQDFSVSTANAPWPSLSVNATYSPQGWTANINELDVALLLPLREIADIPKDIDDAITALAIKGTAKDIRVAQAKEQPLSYSLSLTDVGFQHWTYLPEVHKLGIDVVGRGANGKASLSMVDDQLPYGDFFQAPLDIQQGDVNLYWHLDDLGVVLWSDKVSVRAPHINVLGEFRLDIPREGDLWLSFYGEANANDAGETWRYLPTLALGDELTDFLSAAIRGGTADHAKLLWYGGISTFPYLEHEGMFQADVPLRKAKFSFDTQWPTLTELDLNLLFENDAMYLNATNVGLMDARGYNLKGEIPSLSAEDTGMLYITSDIAASGETLREYMLATPLVDSVGAALTHVQVDGSVAGSISLDIPLNGDDVNAKGSARLNKNMVSIVSPEMTLERVKGKITFDNDKVTATGLRANLLKQPITFGFKGETESENYIVNIDIDGKWEADKLKAALDLPDLSFIEGQSEWDLNVGIALKDIGFTYDVLLDADLMAMSIDLPAPLTKSSFIKSHGYLKASGDAQRLVGQVELPNVKYQADVDISGDIPKVTRSRMVIGEGELALKPQAGNAISVDVPSIDVNAWRSVFSRYEDKNKGKDNSLPVDLPAPSRINVKADKIHAGEMVFNNASIAAREKRDGYHILIGSEELAGDAWWDGSRLLTVSIEHLFLNLDLENKKESFTASLQKAVSGRVTEEDRVIMAKIPATDLVIDELWLQGYRLGRVEAQLLKDKDEVTLSKFTLGSNALSMKATGDWRFTPEGMNQSHVKFTVEGKNSSDLMGRFSVTGGIQDASFNTKGELEFNGVPWEMNVASLDGMLDTQLEDGYISGVGGAGKLLGLFSLDSILRKMQLDFTGVFEDGLAFDEISGSASITNGVVVTDNIQMKALAGDMFIKGIANLAKNQVNAEVRFIPDLTSGIPVFTAFAVTPQTALYVLAVTTVISPVVDAFTQVRYQVTGPIDEPVVREVSRRKAEVTLPEQATERLRSEQQGSKD
ncbi:YhdP family protein [Enterovibrio norvegicus]|uniref:TIGR02099 family protein n=1 Tax=Enterovibrio norvegicus TaxID=188144 RepID=A0A2N7LCX0_9GAMM|nr:YhdP family protein [Enterovibrio norvegicus]PMN68644.1 TIGR02099 family protein [Enterovibrio norvegicus]PMN93061.1 TIGR02099 family protein [Enterovibrio norvegicus]